MKKISVFIIFLAMTQVGISQGSFERCPSCLPTFRAFNPFTNNQPNVNTQLTYEDLKQQNVSGSPYQNDQFIAGAIYYDNKLVKEDVLLRYNIYSSQFEIQDEFLSEKIDGIAGDPNVHLKLDGATYVYVPTEGQKGKGTYFEVISSNQFYKLYKETRVEYIPKQPAKTSYDRMIPASFKTDQLYYLVSPNGDLVKLPTSKNKLIKTLSPKSIEIKKFIKANNINISDEQGLVKLINYYESIMS